MKIASIFMVPALLVAVIAPLQITHAAETYYTDQGHTEVRFGWSHAGVSLQSGEFTKVNGKLVLDPADVEKSKLTVEIDAASVSTGFGPLDDHLKSSAN